MTPQILRYAAFTDDPRGGNPAGVVLDADQLDEAQMLAIAADVGYSETAFVRTTAVDTSGTAHAPVRYFSPEAEVPFCGHATVASAIALARREGMESLTFDTPVGAVPVRLEHTAAGPRATLTSVPTSNAPLADDVLAELLEALRWGPEDLDRDWPVHVAFGGNHHPVLVTRTPERLAELDYSFDALRALSLREDWTTVTLAHAREERVWDVRNPFPVGGVVEDPATGAAAAALGGYLRAQRGLTGDLTLHQGDAMGRPSLLQVRLAPDSPRVEVSGTAVPL